MYEYETCPQHYLGVAESKKIQKSPNIAVAMATKQF